MSKKSQAALEFLTTYGWAFIVILTMIGAVSYFGGLNPSGFVQGSCVVGSPFACDSNQFVVGSKGFVVQVVNGQQATIVSNLQYFYDEDWHQCGQFRASTVQPSSELILPCIFAPGHESSSRSNTNFKFTSTSPSDSDGTFSRTIQGTLRSTRIEQTHPSSIEMLGFVSASPELAGATAIAYHDGYAYVANWNGASFAIVDVSDPNNVEIVGYEQNSSLMAGMHSVKVDDSGILYTAGSNSRRISSYDVSDPSNPVLLDSFYRVDIRPLDMQIVGTTMYVTGYVNHFILILDISDPSNIQELGYLSDSASMNGATDIRVVGDHALIAARGVSNPSTSSGRLAVLDVSDPSDIIVEDVYLNHSIFNWTWSLDVAGDYAYVVAARSGSLVTFDISDLPNIEMVHVDQGNLVHPRHVMVGGNKLYVADLNDASIKIYDVSNPAQPSYQGDYHRPGFINSARYIDINYPYLYLASMSNTVSVFDIS